MQIPKYVIFFLECLISKCCCGPHEAQNFDLRHHRSTFVTIRIIKNDREMPQSWSGLFWSPSAHRPFWRNSIVKIKLCGLPNLVRFYLLFGIVVFPDEMLTFLHDHEFLSSYKSHIYCISNGNTHILERPWIVCFHRGFTFVARPC